MTALPRDALKLGFGGNAPFLKASLCQVQCNGYCAAMFEAHGLDNTEEYKWADPRRGPSSISRPFRVYFHKADRIWYSLAYTKLSEASVSGWSKKCDTQFDEIIQNLKAVIPGQGGEVAKVPEGGVFLVRRLSGF